MYLAWYDAAKKLSAYEKIENAYGRYREKFGTEPTEVLVNAGLDLDAAQLPGHLVVRPQDNIGLHCFWIGTPEDDA